MAKQEQGQAQGPTAQELSPQNPGKIRRYWIGLKPDAPVHVLKVPTHAKVGKTVVISRHTGRLDEHPVNPDQRVKTEKGNIGSEETLSDLDYQTALKFIETHGWVVKPQLDEVTQKTILTCRTGTYVPLQATNKDEAIRSPYETAQSSHVVPMADYVWMVLSENKGHFPGIPPTISEQKAAKPQVAVA